MTSISAIVGPPGTGKTSEIVRIVRRMVQESTRGPYDHGYRLPAVVCSLTRAAASEAAGRDSGLPRTAVATIHAFAYRALQCPELTAGREAEFNSTPGLPSCHHVSVTETARRKPRIGPEGMDERGEDTQVIAEAHEAATADREAGDSLRERYGVLRAQTTPREDWPPDVSEWATAWGGWKTDAQLLDFPDLIEIAARERTRCPGDPEAVLVDEAQDASRAQLDLLRVWATQAGGLTIVGDPWQSLYGWTGAHRKMFLSDKITNLRVLSQSWRVPRAVHSAAVGFLGGNIHDYTPFDYEPRDADGEVIRSGVTWQTPEDVVTIAEAEARAGRTVMVLATCDYMLRGIVSAARRRGMPFANRWRMKRGDWNPLAPRRGNTIARALNALLDFDETWTVESFRRWTQRMPVSAGLRRKARSAIAAAAHHAPGTPMTSDDLEAWILYDEDAPIYRIVREMMSNDPRAAARAWAASVHRDSQALASYTADVWEGWGSRILDGTDDPPVTIGTIHSIKGGEADVVILLPDLSPAATAAWHGGGEPHNEVAMAGYVGMTRARETLIVGTPCKWFRSMDLGV